MKVSDPATRKSMTLKEFAALCGVPYSRFHYRLRVMGMSIMAAVTEDSKELKIKNSTKHGWSGTRTYTAWESMISRCARHKNYLKLGITVCDRWLDFENFLADMGAAPDGLSLDRKNGKLGYFKGNCRWATPIEQSQNTSRNINVTAFGKTQCVSEWARETGINEKTLRQRLERGYSPEKALTATRYERVNHAR